MTPRVQKPETLVKKEKVDEKTAQVQAEYAKAKAALDEEKKAIISERTAKYYEEYEEAARVLEKAKSDAAASGSYFVEAEPNLVLVVRIKGINKIAPKPRKVLQLLRLLQINAAVFVRITKATAELLRLVEPYVAYGYPSLETVRELIYKRGYGKLNKQRVPLTDNDIIEKVLGQYGIISIEDLIHEIYTVGPNFKQANNFLYPFRLSNPDGGWGVRRKFFHYIQGGATGNREEHINSLVKKMN
ncbi:60S ribosomal protein L7-A [Komagataella phaffii CBS 7435]|uniref:60S ribosomal protein L7-A n=1 Tax=Komagataella phaffii (strain ATCC 76273 / CBS 7435 / CECT 11047 / NRRL Y-11430 / Wegner 21-1) TaxID=981350 RepID=F2QU82_KOMPC|nr:60S ribosomal protein L7-A [Komagataella phaffii CBS 7435]CCA38960.1 60S ribosomal protein L7-A [Komagataella phaffii CBS 7435]